MNEDRKTAEPTITLTQLIEQLQKYQGQVIHHAAILAINVMNGAKRDADAKAKAQT